MRKIGPLGTACRYRQAEIHARAGVQMARPTMAQWVGICGTRLAPQADALRQFILGHGDPCRRDAGGAAGPGQGQHAPCLHVGLLSVDNLAILDALKVGERPLEYIVAMPGRRYAEFVDVLADVQPLCAAATTEVVGEVAWSPAKARQVSVKRLVWAHDPLRAAEQGA